jgi:hypothetical protein
LQVLAVGWVQVHLRRGHFELSHSIHVLSY